MNCVLEMCFRLEIGLYKYDFCKTTSFVYYNKKLFDLETLDAAKHLTETRWSNKFINICVVIN